MEHKLINQYQHIIYIGCGADVAIKTLAGQAQKLWLIDAADQVIEQLRLQAEKQDLPVYIQQALVLPQTQQATFYEYNLPWVNGPAPAGEDLHRLYPGLCRTHETQQKGLDVVELLWQCLADAEQTSNNLLIIDLEQQTQALLHALAESEVLHFFAQVLVVPPHRGQPLSLPSSLQAAHKPLPAGVPQNTQSFQLAPWVLELQRLQQQLAEANASEQKHKDWVHSLKQQLNELATQCENLSQQRDEQSRLVNENRAQLNQYTQDLNTKNAELTQVQQQLIETKNSEKKYKEWAHSLKERLEKQQGLSHDTQELQKKLDREKEKQKETECKHNKLLKTNKNHESAISFFSFFDNDEHSQSPFLLIDSKSLPRSGLHYLKNTLAWLLGDQFSFCEWYQEPGCCKSNPCKITSYAAYASKNKTTRIRLIKSHDFDLSDPFLDSSKHLQQVVLIREPIYVLTSWFLLDQFTRYKDTLLSQGIDTTKIYLHHEKETIHHAISILDEVFENPSDSYLAEWIEKRSKYISGFLNKWASKESNSTKNAKIIHYDEIDDFILEIVERVQEHISKDVLERVKSFANKKTKFKPRDNAFLLPSVKVSEFIKEKSNTFIDASEKIKSFHFE